MGFVQRTLHQVSTERISEERLIEQGVTAYAAAREQDIIPRSDKAAI